jgi:hypothetical protein
MDNATTNVNTIATSFFFFVFEYFFHNSYLFDVYNILPYYSILRLVCLSFHPNFEKFLYPLPQREKQQGLTLVNLFFPNFQINTSFFTLIFIFLFYYKSPCDKNIILHADINFNRTKIMNKNRQFQITLENVLSKNIKSITYGILGGINSKIQLAKSRAGGYRNPKNFINTIYFTCAKFKFDFYPCNSL